MKAITSIEELNIALEHATSVFCKTKWMILSDKSTTILRKCLVYEFAR